MDSLRGRFSDRDDYEDHNYDLDDETGHEPPPSPVGQDERRMQVRAYNHWASLLDNRSFPSIEDLEPANLPDFSPYSVLLDFTGGMEDPGVPFLGARLAQECLAEGEIEHLSDVPSRSLLSRITDHYMQILANQAPIGFEAEFVNARGATILYRGILLPFSSDDDTIDFIYGVINWKELADQKTSDELLLEIDQALSAVTAPVAGMEPLAPESFDQIEDEPEAAGEDAPMAAWADGPPDGVLDLDSPLDPTLDAPFDVGLGLDLGGYDVASFDIPDFDVHNFDISSFDRGFDPDDADAIDWPQPSFGEINYGEAPSLFGDNGILAKKDRSGFRGLLAGAALPRGKASEAFEAEAADAGPVDASAVEAGPVEAGAVEANAWESDDFGHATDHAAADAEPEPRDVTDFDHDVVPEVAFGHDIDFDDDIQDDFPPAEALPRGMGLSDWLASAREMAQVAKGSEDRSRVALYAAIGRAYDFSLAAVEEPAAFEALVAEAGLTIQDRAPMTPVVKLVFGADYDKTRLTEYASALSHGHRLALGLGMLAEFLSVANGGLKGVVQSERALKREETGKPALAERETPRDALARKLRRLGHRPLAEIESEGREFTLLVARRLPTGEVVLLGEVADDVPMLERAARRLLG